MKRYKKLFESKDIISEIKSLLPEITKVAQKVYDEWNEEDVDTYAGGGICHLIAEKISDVFYYKSKNLESVPFSLHSEQHVINLVFNKKTKEIYMLNLPPYIYEKGGGFSWTKIPNIKISPRDFIINQVDWEEYFDEYGEMYEI